jgi:hypothetical protein
LTQLTGCLAQKPQIKEQRRYWGSKEKCIAFLQSDKAVAERWVLEALGE